MIQSKQSRLRLHKPRPHTWWSSKRVYRGFILSPGKWHVSAFPGEVYNLTPSLRDRLFNVLSYWAPDSGKFSRLTDLLDAIDDLVASDPRFQNLVVEDDE